MRAVAVVLSLSLLACFPNNARHRTIAKITEGAFVVGGIALLATSNTQADCDDEMRLGGSVMTCKSNRGLISGLGLALIMVGMVGFFATVTTEPDDKAATVGKPATTTPPLPSTAPTPITTPGY